MAFSTLDGSAQRTRPGRRPQADRKAETRRRILASARPVFLRDGFLAANLNEISRAAGVGKGTLYRHFENKGELYLAVLSEHGDRLVEEMREAVAGTAPALAQIEQIANFYVSFWVRNPEYFKIIWAVQNPELIGPLSDDLAQRVRETFERPLRLLEGLIRSGVERGELRACDPWNVANAIAICGNAVVGYVIGAVSHPVERDPEAIFDALLAVLLRGLAPPAR